jgi:hypothetical protein
MTTVMQKVVLPGREQLWAQGDDQLVGFVVSAADVAWARTPRDLLEVHGLGFPGSPFSPESTAVDVLRFASSPFMRFVNATGAPSTSAGEPLGEGFIDHLPFSGNGFAPVTGDYIVPVWWLEPTRVPPPPNSEGVQQRRYRRWARGALRRHDSRALPPRPRHRDAAPGDNATEHLWGQISRKFAESASAMCESSLAVTCALAMWGDE